jgi:hypothetical protein
MNTTDPKAAMTHTDADEPDLGGDCDGLDVSPSPGHSAGVTPATRWEAPGGYTIPVSAFRWTITETDAGALAEQLRFLEGRQLKVPIGSLGEGRAPLMDAVRKSGALVTSTVKLPRGMDLHDATIPAPARAVCTIEVPAEGWPPRWNPALGYTGWMDGPPDGVGVHKRRGARLPNTEPVRRAAWVLEGAR